MVEAFANQINSFAIASANTVEIRGLVSIKRKFHWVERYAVLEGSMLYYYKKFSDVKPRVVLSMTKSTIKGMGKVDKTRYVISIVTDNKANIKMRLSNENTYNEWLQAFDGSTKQALGPDPESPDILGRMDPFSALRSKIAEHKARALDQITIAQDDRIVSQIKKWIDKGLIKGSLNGVPVCHIQEQVSSDKSGVKLSPKEMTIAAAILGLGIVVDSLIGSQAMLGVVVAGFLFLLSESRTGQTKPAQRKSFCTEKIVHSSVGNALSVLNDASKRGNWDPYLKSALIVRNNTLRLTYNSPTEALSSVEQQIEPIFVVDDKTYYYAEKVDMDFKQIFIVEEVASYLEPKVKVTHYGEFMQGGQPDPLVGNLATLESLTTAIEGVSSEVEPVEVDEDSDEEDQSRKSEQIELPEGMTLEQYQRQQYFEKLLKEAVLDVREIMALTDGWETLKIADKTVNASRRKAAGGIYIIRAQSIINRPKQEILDYLNDITLKQNYDEMFDSGHFPEKLTEETRICYMKYKKVLTVSPRDFVVIQTKIDHEDGMTYAVGKSIDYPECPPVKGIVRATLFMGTFAFKTIDENSCDVTYLIHADLGGSIPGFAVNKVQSKQPMILSKIKKLLNG